MPSTIQKAVDEVLARLLAVGDDVDAAVLLQPERSRVASRLASSSAGPRAAMAATICSVPRARLVWAGCRLWWRETATCRQC